MQIDGVSYNTLLSIVSEVGVDLAKKFESAKQFTSWLGLCPNKKVSGGKVLSSKTKKNKSKLALAFRQAANVVGNQKDTVLSNSFRRLSHRKGRKVAIMAISRKLAVIVYHMLTKGEQYAPENLEEYAQKVRNQKIKLIRKNLKRHNISLEELSS